jgi:hypothetical protein
MHRNTVRFSSPALAAIMLVIGAAGCELIASVDRSKIPSDNDAGGEPQYDASAADGPMAGDSGSEPDATTKADTGPATDGSTGGDTGPDADATVGTDGGSDGASDGETRDAAGDGHAGTCEGGATACTDPSQCAASASACVVDTCTAGCCGTTDATKGTACTDDGGKVCDGAGKCVGCLAATDCPAQTTVCKVNTCTSAHACGAQNAPKGTQCNDSGGVICDGNGTCVSAHCTDGMKDADETDTDCGGSCGGCADSKSCKVGGDCVDKVCSGTPLTCQAPTCTDGAKNGAETDVDCGGMACDTLGKLCATSKGCGGNADCASGDCTSGACALAPLGHACGSGPQCTSGSCVGGICCSSDCSGTCQACTAALTGKANGTCANVTAGTAAPAGQCAVTTACGNDGNCDGTGACELAPATTVCTQPSCMDGLLTAAAKCNGTGMCGIGVSGDCPGGVKCASGSACLPSCGGDGDCQSTSTYCGGGGTCVAKGMGGAACSAADQCSNGLCGPNGTGGTHCCSNTCMAAVMACAATDCKDTGACIYPDNSTVPSSGQTPGDCQKLVCNSMGGTVTADDPSDVPMPTTVCKSGACVGTNPSVPSITNAATGTSCVADNQWPNHVCGDPAGPVAGQCVQCNSDPDCLPINDAGSSQCMSNTCL